MHLERSLIIDAYIAMATRRIDIGFEPVLLTFMFNQLPGNKQSRQQQMDREVEKAYSKTVWRMFRHPHKLNLEALPLWIVCPDWPVPKTDKDHIRDLSVNDGEHRHAAALVPPNRLKTSFADYITEEQRHFTGSERPVWRIDAQPILQTPEKAIGYALKSLSRGRVSAGDVYVLPRVASEL